MAASPPLAPRHREGPIYFVLCNFGPKIGKTYVETDPDAADRATVLSLLIRGEFRGPVQVLEVDLQAGRVRDASADFAEEILSTCRLDDLPSDVATFATLRSALRAVYL